MACSALPGFVGTQGPLRLQNIPLLMGFRIYQYGWNGQTDPQTLGSHDSPFHSPATAQK